MNLVEKWSEPIKEAFQKDIITFNHKVDKLALFSDEALAALLDKHPHEMLDVCTRGQDFKPEYPNELRTGDFRDCSGKQLIEAAKNGWIWINMRRAMNVHPEYKEILDGLYAAVSKETGVKIYNPNGGILITAPSARTPYHFDKTEVILWHLRGQKRVYVYPLEQTFIPDTQFEEILLNPIKDDLSYQKDFDTSAKVINLKPGQAITWPLNSPHRVDNSSFCVSITTEYSTRQSGMKNAAMIANATLRRKLGTQTSYSQQTDTGRLFMSMFGHALKKTGLAAKAKPKDMVSFRVDPSVPGSVVDIDPFERDF